MGKAAKILVYVIAAFVALMILSGLAVSLLFDPNDYRDEISATVKRETGRDLVIEGDISMTVFPWLAVEIGRSRLGNAPGFGDEPFASFEKARLSVSFLPLALRNEIVVGEAALDSLMVNLAVDRSGRSNWQDLTELGEGRPDPRDELPPGVEARATINVNGIEVSNSALVYDDAQTGERFELRALNVSTSEIGAGEPVRVAASLEFSAQPAGTSGGLEFETVVEYDDDIVLLDGLSLEATLDGLAEVPVEVSFDAPAIELQTKESIADVGSLEFSVADLRLNADVEPFSYADSPTPRATLSIDAFSPRSLANALNIELPATADPSALGKAMLEARADVSKNSITLSDLVLVVDETTFRGSLVVPRSADGAYELNLAGDSIDLGRYMEPPPENAQAGAGGAPPAEIPADLVRALNARGKLTLASAELGGMKFEAVDVGLTSANDRLRINPLTATFFGGSYNGDIRIDATGNVPVLSVNERIENVSLTSLGEAMLGRRNLSGTIEGIFRLSGRGNNMAEVQRALGGNLSFTLKDGAWEGFDLWYQLRRARAAYRKEEPPEAPATPRTRFSEVSATGTVTNGILSNDDFAAQLPFMRLNGRGTVNLPEATVDYSLSGRVFEQPELMDDVTPEEIEDLTQAVIPLKISGPLASPRVGVDFEALLRERVKEELENKVEDALKDKLKGLLGGRDDDSDN